MVRLEYYDVSDYLALFPFGERFGSATGSDCARSYRAVVQLNTQSSTKLALKASYFSPDENSFLNFFSQYS